MKLDAKPSPQLHASSPQSGGAGASTGVSTGAAPSPMSSVNPNHVGSHNNQGDARGTVLNQNSGQSPAYPPSHPPSQNQDPASAQPSQPRSPQEALSPWLRQYQPLAPPTGAQSQLAPAAQSQGHNQANNESNSQRNNQGQSQTGPLELDEQGKLETKPASVSVDYADKQALQKVSVLLVNATNMRINSADSPPTSAATEVNMQVPPKDSQPNPKPAPQPTSTQQPSVDLTLKLPIEQVRSLNQQWVEVIQVRAISTEIKLPLAASETAKFQLELSTPLGKIQVLSQQPFQVGDKLQLQLGNLTQSQLNTGVIQINALRAGAPQTLAEQTQAHLLQALRQYQPLQNTLQVLALQQIESGRMQSLASDIALRFNPSADTAPTFNPLQTSKFGQLKQQVVELLTQPANVTSKTEASTNANATSPNTTSASPVGLATKSAPVAPHTLLVSNKHLAVPDIRAAIQQAGQQLEFNLNQLQSEQSKSVPLDAQKNNSITGMNLARGFMAINQNLQSGIKDLLRELAGKPSSSPSVHPQAAHPQTTQVKPDSAPTAQASTETTLLSSLKDAVRNDMKAWLMQNQVHLMQAIQADPKGKQDQKDLMDGLLKVLFNRAPGANPSGDSEGQRILPKNLSVQPQLQKLFSGLLTQSQSDDGDQPLRQLLSLTQTLTRIQQEQVMNRQQQVQNPESPEFQMSLPYLQDKQINWCELEFGPHTEQENTKQVRRGWHLILRFEHAAQGAFAVEASLAGNELTLALWSHTQDRLKQFHQHMELFKHKLQEAGFVCEQIQSKHGMPERKQRQIQQGLVDVRT